MGVAMKLTDLPKDAFVSIVHKLDLQSILGLAKASRKTKEGIEDEFVWIKLCDPWKQVVNLKVWRAEADSAKALYRLLHSLNKLVGLWSQRDDNPCGELVYVTWGIRGLEGWRVVPGSRDADEAVKFVKYFDVTGSRDGSPVVDLVSVPNRALCNAHMSAQLALPSSRAPDQFMISNQCNMLAWCILSSYQQPESRETEVWQKVYKKVLIGEASPGKELTGLWTGLYGPHGWEILTISYVDDQFVVGTKVIGDPHVPSGEVTFKGNLSLVAMDLPNLLSNRDRSRQLTKKYRGQGRIALENFLNPQWVQGLLLVEQSGNFYFVWADINFMIRFYRLDVEALFRKQQPGVNNNTAATGLAPCQK